MKILGPTSRPGLSQLAFATHNLLEGELKLELYFLLKLSSCWRFLWDWPTRILVRGGADSRTLGFDSFLPLKTLIHPKRDNQNFISLNFT